MVMCTDDQIYFGNIFYQLISIFAAAIFADMPQQHNYISTLSNNFVDCFPQNSLSRQSAEAFFRYRERIFHTFEHQTDKCGFYAVFLNNDIITKTPGQLRSVQICRQNCSGKFIQQLAECIKAILQLMITRHKDRTTAFVKLRQYAAAAIQKQFQ